MKNNNAGITLVEVIVAVAIFAFAATPLLGVFSYSLKIERRSLTSALAAYTAQMEMEKAYGMYEDELVSTYGDKSGTFNIADSVELYYKYRAVMFVPELDPDDENAVDYSSFNLYKVTITVGNEFHKVETTLEDILYARPSES